MTIHTNTTGDTTDNATSDVATKQGASAPSSASPPASAPTFTFPVRVYYEDTDAAGVVYYANYLKFLERARTEWLSAQNIELTALERDEATVFVVKRVEVDYLAAARLGDRLKVTVSPEAARAAALTLSQKILREDSNQLIIEAVVTLVTLNTRSWFPTRLPDGVRALLRAHYPNLL